MRALFPLLVVAACGAPPAAVRAGTRLIDELPFALELPPPPALRSFLSLDELGIDAARAGVVFRPGREGFVFRMRLGGSDARSAGAELRALSAGEAAQFGDRPRAIEGAPPGTPLGACVRPAFKGRPRVMCQRLGRLPPSAEAVLAVIDRPALGATALEAREVRLPDLRAPLGPRTSPLARRIPRASGAGQTWRNGLWAPAGGRYVFEAVLPPGATLRVDTALWPTRERSRVRFLVRAGDLTLLDETLQDTARWSEHRLPLPGRKGERVRLTLEAQSDDPAAAGLWGEPRVLETIDAPSIVLFTLDAARPDHLSAYGYDRPTTPALERLAQVGARFDRAYAQAPNSWQSATSFLSGVQPLRSGVRRTGDPLPPGLRLLPDLLAARGYETWADPQNALTADELASFDAVENPLLLEGGHVEEALQRLAPQIAARPTFAWFHLANPHYPLQPREPLRFDPGYQGPSRDAFTLLDHADQRPRPEAVQRHIDALYDSALRDADALVKLFLSALDAAGGSERTIVVVSADHGELLGEHGAVLEHALPYDAALHVPLLFTWLGHVQPGARVAATVQLVDLAPTLLALAGLAPAPGLDGRDLTPALRGEPLADAPAFSDALGEVQVMLRGREKLLVAPLHREYDIASVHARFDPVELYDLAADPGELHNLAQVQPERAAAAREALRAQVQRWREQGMEPPSTAPLGQSALEAMQAAGYMPAGAAAGAKVDR